jgi:hypothetical protein
MLRAGFELAHAAWIEGTCLEFGVFEGTSFLWQARQLKERRIRSRLFGFDSWQGLPGETSGVYCPPRHAQGEYAARKDKVLDGLRAQGLHRDRRIRLIDGFYEDSLTDKLRSKIKRPVIFVNIDVDIHSSTLLVLDFIGPLLEPNTFIYWDDWVEKTELGKPPSRRLVHPDDLHKTYGEKLAWEQWSARHPRVEVETVLAADYGRRIMRVVAV